MSTFDERSARFEEEVHRRTGSTATTRVHRAFGVSNSARIIVGGVQVGLWNMERFEAQADGALLYSVIRFAPADEVLFALHIRADFSALFTRLAEMKRLGEVVEPDQQRQYAARNNNTAVWLCADGLVRVRNKGFWEELPVDLREAGPGIRVDGLYTAVTPSGTRPGAGARELVDWLVRLIGDERWHPLGLHEADPELGRLLERSRFVHLTGPDALGRAVRYATARVGPSRLFFDPFRAAEATLIAALDAAEAAPDRSFFSVHHAPEPLGQQWLTGLQLAGSAGLMLGGRRRHLPGNLQVLLAS